MTIFLICMIPVSAFIVFMLCALLQDASAAGRQKKEYFERKSKEQKEKTA